MFIDDIKNNYFYPTGNKSVVLETPKEWVTQGKESYAVLRSSVARLIDALRVKRPTWRFKSTERVYGPEAHELSNFDVYDGDEKLGTVWVERHWRTAQERYCLNNYRIEASKQRGHGSFSTKLNVAVKKILDSFGVKSLDERASDAQKIIQNVVSMVASEHKYKFAVAQRRVLNALADYIVDNWEQMRVHAGSDGHVDLFGLRKTSHENDAILEAFTRKAGTMLVTRGEQLLVWRDTSEAKPVGWDALTDKQRGSLGMLKMVENRTSVPGVGVRVEADKFFLLD